jgi:hypothetical protein
MNLDEMVKYIIWVVIFLLALGGVYAMLKNLGVL